MWTALLGTLFDLEAWRELRQDRKLRTLDERIELLEAENERLAAALDTQSKLLRVAFDALAAQDILPPSYVSHGEESGSPPRPTAASAKFACSTCGRLLPESELERLEVGFRCGECAPRTDDEGRYR